MSSLNNEQKQLLFDHCMGLTSQEQSVKADALISDNKEAAVFYSKLNAFFAPLDSVGCESCPDDLVKRTILKINNHADSNKQLTQLLTAEQNKKSPFKISFLSNFSEVAAIAAAILLIAGVLVPTFGYARQKHWQKRCQAQLFNIFEGFQSYIFDNDNKEPSVPKQSGADWWKIGHSKQSNTSHMYLLVKGMYVEPVKFICPSKRNKETIDNSQFQTYSSNFRNYEDFPDRRYITYSFQIRCQKTEDGELRCRKVLMADRNPHFEDIEEDHSKTIRIELKREQLNANSLNHNRSGQNVLCGDGSAEFQKTRLFGTDDIYTLQNTDIYRGNETPSCKTDVFLAP